MQILKDIYTICVQPLVTAINELTAATRASREAGSGSVGTASEAKEEKAKPGPKKKKLTLDDVQGVAKSIPAGPKRDKVRARMKAEFGLDSTKDATEEQYEGIMKMMEEVKTSAEESDDL